MCHVFHLHVDMLEKLNFYNLFFSFYFQVTYKHHLTISSVSHISYCVKYGNFFPPNLYEIRKHGTGLIYIK